MLNVLPAIFLERLRKIIPCQHYDAVESSFSSNGAVTVRINTLKVARADVLQALTALNISYKEISWYHDALILDGLTSPEYGELAMVKQGQLYRQSLSSMLPVVILNPQPGEQVLDFCAAPGSKTTQIAAMMKNEGELIAVEAVRPRFYRLKAVCTLLGARNVMCKLTDARRFRSQELFDKILVDAPCSSESRFKTDDLKSVGYWSPRKIKEMVHKQRGLLLSASRFLKSGGVLVYSTCTFAPEENEGVIDWVLRKSEGQLTTESIEINGVPSYPAINMWEERAYDSQVKNCLRVLPDGIMEGFFVAKLIKR